MIEPDHHWYTGTPKDSHYPVLTMYSCPHNPSIDIAIAFLPCDLRDYWAPMPKMSDPVIDL
jgi:hypothetical protein